eukprot:2600565-Prymnesium_polylepis.1
MVCRCEARRGSPTAVLCTAEGPRGRASQRPWPRCALILVRALKILVDVLGTTRKEGEAERGRQRPLQPDGERGIDARCKTLIAPLTAKLHNFGAEEACSARENHDQARSSRTRCACCSRPGRRSAQQRGAQIEYRTAARGGGSTG